MKKQDYTNKTEQELLNIVKEAKQRLKSLLFDLKLARLQDTSAVKRARKEIARVLTVLKTKYGKRV